MKEDPPQPIKNQFMNAGSRQNDEGYSKFLRPMTRSKDSFN
jgi:hypothetical protein